MSVESEVAHEKFVAGMGVQMEINEWTVNGRTYRNWKYQRIGEKKAIIMGDQPMEKEEKVHVDVKSKKEKKNKHKKTKKSESERSVEVETPLVKNKKKSKEPVEIEDDPSLVKMIDLEQPRSYKKSREHSSAEVKPYSTISVASEVSLRRPSPIARNAKQRRVEMEEEWDRKEEVKRASAEKIKPKQESREYIGPVPKRESSECDLDKSLKMAMEKKTKRMSREQLTDMCYRLQHQMNNMQMKMFTDLERLQGSKNQRAAINTAKQIGELLNLGNASYNTVMQLIGEEELPDAKEKMAKVQAFINAIAALHL